MKNLKCIARTALAGFALLSAVCGTALAGGGPSSGGDDGLESVLPGEDITSLPISQADTGFFFTGRPYELRELLGSASLRGSVKVVNLGGGQFSVVLSGDSELVVERERLSRTNVRMGFLPGRLFQGDQARLVLNQGTPIDFRADEIGLPVSRMARADAVEGVGIMLRILGPREAFRGGVLFTGERTVFAQRITLGG